MTHPAANKTDLKRRVARFFSREQERDQTLNSLLGELKNICEPYIFGGLVRDIALRGIGTNISDIDIVFEGDPSLVADFVRKYKPNKNRFGGYRFTTNHWRIDLWEAKASWAFQSGNRSYIDINSILETTITNWDAILFDLRSGSVVNSPDYFQDIQDGFLDMVFIENPNKMGMYIRLLRTLSNYQTLKISSSVANNLYTCFRLCSIDEITKYEITHYKSQQIDKVFCLELDRYISSLEPSLLPMTIQAPTKNLQLFAQK